MKNRANNYGPHYPARRLLALVGDKWTPIVPYSLSDSVKRFSELQRDIRDISKKMLVQVLRALEASGLGDRKVYRVVPPRAENRLTVDGRIIHEPVARLCTWAGENEDFLVRVGARSRGATRQES